MFYSSVLLDSLWGGVDAYTVGDNSWHWDYTQNRMDNYLGGSGAYDPMGIIYGNSGGYVNHWSVTQSYTNNALNWLGHSPSWSYTQNSVNAYLNSWLYW